jgi:hypothetical protein
MVELKDHFKVKPKLLVLTLLELNRNNLIK